MDNLLVNMGISFVLTAIKESVKNEKKKADLKAAFLKIRNAIDALYPDEA